MAEGRFKVPEHLAVRVPAAAMRASVEDLFVANGMPAADAKQAADVLIWADLRGIDSHGVSNMMAFYIQGLKDGNINPAPEWKATVDFGAIANIDSDRGLGLVVGPPAMRLAIHKARQFGVGCVVAGNGRHFGAAGYHAAMALEHGMVGMAMTVGGPARQFGERASDLGRGELRRHGNLAWASHRYPCVDRARGYYGKR